MTPIVFNSESRDLGGFTEIVKREAVEATLKGSDIIALNGHDTKQVLGRESNGTLSLSVDNVGVHAEIDLPNTSYANDLFESVQRQDIFGASFGFDIEDFDVSFTEDKREIVELTKINLHEISVVAIPAYPQTKSETLTREYKEQVDGKTKLVLWKKKLEEFDK